MRDLSPEAKVFWWVAVLLGGAAVGLAVIDVSHGSLVEMFQILFGVLFAGLSARFAVRIREARTSGGAAELFVFLLLLEYGNGAAVLAATASVAAASWRKHVRWTQRLGRPAVAAVAMFPGRGRPSRTAAVRAGGRPRPRSRRFHRSRHGHAGRGGNLRPQHAVRVAARHGPPERSGREARDAARSRVAVPHLLRCRADRRRFCSGFSPATTSRWCWRGRRSSR